MSTKPTPDVDVVVRWPAGTSFVTTVQKNLPDRPKWRAVAHWWEQALAQTEQFSLTSTSLGNQPDVPKLELTVEPRGKTLTVAVITGKEQRQLTTCSFADDSETPELLLAIDHAAWCTRLALGEAARQPQPVAAVTSNRPAVVNAIADATELLHSGAFVSANRTLRLARQGDGGAPFVLEPLAAMELLRGDADTAARIATEALSYTERTSPTVQHRLARTLLMARASQRPQNSANFDRQMLTLAKVARRERPHDEEPVWTAALAHNFLGEFDQARPLLEKLQLRRPQHAFVPYHLGWSCLGTGDAAAAADHLKRAAMRLPPAWVLLPRAVALHESGRHDELDALLETARTDYARDDQDSINHAVLRMQAANALLLGKDDRARNLLLEDLRWLARNPATLAGLAGELSEAGAVLVRLGSAKELPMLLAGIQKQHSGTLIADATAFLAGMHQVKTTGARAAAIERALGRDGDNAWAAMLAAFAHEQRGEVGDMQNELARASRLSSSPMTKALVAHSLRKVGKMQEAALLQGTLRAEMAQLHLRQTCQHPLFGPELAYAYMLR